jgi:protein-S-isoprenylcysteine O-methyltransferase Ste14
MNKLGANLVLTLVAVGAVAEVVSTRLSAIRSPLGGIGLFLLVPGFILWTIARFQLGRSFTLSAQAIQLVTRGLYSRIRNPVYVFGSCVIAGLILLGGRPLWLLVFVIIIPLQIWRVGKEAQVLEARFGDAYRAYRASTWF